LKPAEYRSEVAAGLVKKDQRKDFASMYKGGKLDAARGQNT
jgi:hypothetical protein